MIQNEFAHKFPYLAQVKMKEIFLFPTNCLSVFDHFVGLALKWLSYVFFICIEKFIYLIHIFCFSDILGTAVLLIALLVGLFNNSIKSYYERHTKIEVKLH